MHLRFSRTADYGLRATLAIAQIDGGLVKRRDIASATEAPESVLAQALAALVRADLLEAVAGPSGGYRLARPATEISVRQIVESIDGTEIDERCPLREARCSHTGKCPFHTVFWNAKKDFRRALGRTSLQMILDEAADGDITSTAVAADRRTATGRGKAGDR